MDSFTARAAERGQKALSDLPAKLNDFEGKGAEVFAHAASAVPTKMNEHAVASIMGDGAMNPTLDAIATKVTLTIAELNGELQKVERWIKMSVPQAEDGNNWGVEVQGFVLKTVSDERTALKAARDKVETYYKERADAIEKVLASKSEKETTSSGKNSSKGGEKDEDKTTSSNSTETTVTKGAVVADRKQHLTSIDTKWYFAFQDMYEGAITGAAHATDTVQKNLSKVKNPRGEVGDDGGSRPMHMY